MTTLAIVALTAEEKTWLGADVSFHYGSGAGTGATGQVVALAPRHGHVWVCDGEHFTEVPIVALARGWQQASLI